MKSEMRRRARRREHDAHGEGTGVSGGRGDGCDDEVIPLQERIKTVGDDADLQEVYDTERHLLYVACTRARDHLLVTSVEPASEFLADLGKNA